jgi:formylglycine-generating enzyme required for sulfatase activity
VKSTPYLVLSLIIAASCGEREEPVPDPVPPIPEDTLFVTIEGGIFVTSWGDTAVIETFDLARYEVSNRLFYWLADKGDVDLPPDPFFPGMEFYLFEYPDYPVVNLNAREAELAASVIGCRLPTAAEWEYAASLGIEGDLFSLYPWGTLDPVDAGYPVNYLAEDEWETRALDGFPATAPIGSFPLSGSGLADLAGNVSEWTHPILSVCKVKGGSWISPADKLTIGSSQDIHPNDRSWYIGFRLAR